MWNNYFWNSDGFTLGSSTDTVFHTNFPGNIFCVKRPHLTKTSKLEP